MARTKAPSKAKEPVKVRFKQLANGNKSIYLDCYVNGRRSYEFLNLYLVKENTPIDKRENKAALNAANNIKAQRIIDIVNGKAGISKKMADDVLLTSFIEAVSDATRKEPQGRSRAENMLAVSKHIIQYKGNNVTLSQVDEDYCRGFAIYLKGATSRFGNALSINTKSTYFTTFSAVLEKAVEKGYLSANPCERIKGKARPQMEMGARDFLSADELKRMEETESSNPKLAQAFIFSCLSGLRLSDIHGLTWGNVAADGSKIETRMQKTQQAITIYLPSVARGYLPERGNAKDTDRVFDIPTSRATIERVLNKWATKAGVTEKHVTFHVARHTYATMLLERGADIYTISKMLGHANVATTQVYATLLDEKKAQAATLLDDMFR